MPKSPLVLKSTVTRRAEPVPPDLAEQLRQLRHHEQAESPQQPDSEQPPTAAPVSDAPPADSPPTTVEKPAKSNPHALQQGFLSRLLGKPCTVYMLNGIRLSGKLHRFDQFTVLIASMDGAE